jgi:hypothetical protein
MLWLRDRPDSNRYWLVFTAFRDTRTVLVGPWGTAL